MNKIRFLIVDDEEDITSLLSKYLISKGHSVTKANSPNEALKMIRTDHVFDVAIVDYVLENKAEPKMDGIDLINKIKSELEEPPLFFLITGMKLDVQTPENYLIINKPFSMLKLYKTIYYNLSMRNRALERRQHPRLRKVFPVKISGDETDYITSNVSKGGLFIGIQDPLDINEKRDIELVINNRTYKASVQVVWKRGVSSSELEKGNGFKFIDCSPLFLEDLEQTLVKG